MNNHYPLYQRFHWYIDYHSRNHFRLNLKRENMQFNTDNSNYKRYETENCHESSLKNCYTYSYLFSLSNLAILSQLTIF